MTTSFLVLAHPGGVAGLDAAGRLGPTRRWSSVDGTVEVLTWAERGWADDHHEMDAAGVVAWGGRPLAIGTDGRRAATASALRGAAERPSPERWDGLRGTWGAAVLDAGGSGTVFADALGLRPLYVRRLGRGLAVGTDPHRVAAADRGELAGRDVAASAALGAVATRLPRRSGYVGVEVLDPGESVRVRAGGIAEVEAPGPPWLALGALAEASPDELLAVVRAELRAGIELALALGEPTVELTGGKDSRLVLAGVLELGVADRLPFETAGPPHLADVQIAQEIAADHGLQHTRVFQRADADPLPHHELFDRFVEETAGMVNGWNARPLLERSGALRISGLNGEALRTHRRLEPTWTPEQRAATVAASAPSSSLGLARPELEELLTEGFGAALDDATARTTTLHDAVDTFLLGVQTRQQYGPLDALQPADRIIVLTSLRAIRAAFALGGPARHAEWAHFATIDAVSPTLARTRFAGDGWPAGLGALVDRDLPELAAPGRPTRGRARTTGPRRAARPASGGPLMASLHQRLTPERRTTLETHLGDPANPVWELLDRPAALDALERYEELGPKQRKELYGAATAACWIAGAG